jgi:hypothetical protein
MFDFTQTMVLIKVLLLSFNFYLKVLEFIFTSEYKFVCQIFFTAPVRDNRYEDFLRSGHWSNCGYHDVNNRNVCRNTDLFHRLHMVHDNRYLDFFDNVHWSNCGYHDENSRNIYKNTVPVLHHHTARDNHRPDFFDNVHWLKNEYPGENNRNTCNKLYP